MLRIQLFFYFILYCFVLRKNPWNFFQIHKKHFDEKKWIFSKFDITQRIPEKWKLQDIILQREESIDTWKEKISQYFSTPVFLKPEWGQNSHGIYRVDDIHHIDILLNEIHSLDIPYICQEWSLKQREFEIFYIKSSQDATGFSVFSITETVDTSHEKHHIQWIHNGSTYKDITSEFSQEEKKQIWSFALQMWDYEMARIGIKADTLESLAHWDFQVFEINIFLPLLLGLLDKNISKETKHQNIKHFAKQLVSIIPSGKNLQRKNIFWNMMKIHRITMKKTW